MVKLSKLQNYYCYWAKKYIGALKFKMERKKMSKVKVARRDFIRATLTVGAALPLAAIPILIKADNHQISEDDPTAKAMGYKHDATQVDPAKYPRRAGESGSKQFCHNCQLYKAGTDDKWGACAIFPGKQVNAKGWCNAWVSA
jgi:hypothetical protein